jgi:hypothetical protein
MAMVFLAGPLSGLIVQSLIGGLVFTFCCARTLLLTVERQDFLPTTQNPASEDGDRKTLQSLVGSWDLLC